MKHRGIEENSVAFVELMLDDLGLEVVLVLLLMPQSVDIVVLVRMRNVDGGATLERHITVSNSSLQSQHPAHLEHMHRVLLDYRFLHETKVVVAVDFLACNSWMHDVYLRGHLIARSEP